MRGTEYWGYCVECEETKRMDLRDYGVLPTHHDYRIVCPVDEEHEVTDGVAEEYDPREEADYDIRA